MPFSFEKLDLAGAVLITPRVFPDDRGFFMETYKHSDFAAFGLDEPLVQENHSMSERGILRGLHYQRPPHGQSKLVRVVAGEIFRRRRRIRLRAAGPLAHCRLFFTGGAPAGGRPLHAGWAVERGHRLLHRR